MTRAKKKSEAPPAESEVEEQETEEVEFDLGWPDGAFVDPPPPEKT